MDIVVDENGKVCGVKLVKMEMGLLDINGCWCFVEVEGLEYVFEVDVVIIVFGF